VKNLMEIQISIWESLLKWNGNRIIFETAHYGWWKIDHIRQ